MKTLINTGELFDMEAPEGYTVTIESIAGSLSKLCRYNGHCSRFYSVAEHSLLVAAILEAQGFSAKTQLAGLLHDAAEAYIGDICTPIKVALGGHVDALERRILAHVADQLGVDHLAGGSMSEIVKNADRLALDIERANLMPPSDEWPVKPEWWGVKACAETLNYGGFPKESKTVSLWNSVDFIVNANPGYHGPRAEIVEQWLVAKFNHLKEQIA